MTYYEARPKKTIEEYMVCKFKCGDDFKKFFKQTEGFCPPKEFKSDSKIDCFYCVDCKRSLFENIKHDKRSKCYKFKKKIMKVSDMEGLIE